MMIKHAKITFVVIVLLALTATAFGVDWISKLFSFSQKDSLTEWEEKIFKDKVIYSVEADRIDSYLKAHSDSSASGIFYRIKFNPNLHPMVSWKWKVIKFPDKSTSKLAKGGWLEKDDYASRFYVIFPAIFFPNTKCLEYVWDNELPAETVMSSPYYGNIKIIVAESGQANIGKWVYEERNIRQDYNKVFGRDPGWVGAIAIMTDTDNTLSTAECDYDEVKVGYKK